MFYLGKISHAYEYVFYCTQCTQLHTKSYITDIQYVIYILSCVQNKKMCAKRVFCVQNKSLCAVCVQLCAKCVQFFPPACHL